MECDAGFRPNPYRRAGACLNSLMFNSLMLMTWLKRYKGVTSIKVDGVMPTCSLCVVRDPKAVGVEVLNAENFARLPVWSVAEGV